jgi:hypothetical protein
MSTEPVIKFSNEESKANIRAKIGQNLLNLIELTKSTVKSSESSELFKNCIKNFATCETLIENSCDKYNKIDIISTQLNYQVDAIKKDCELLEEINRKIEAIQQQH